MTKIRKDLLGRGIDFETDQGRAENKAFFLITQEIHATETWRNTCCRNMEKYMLQKHGEADETKCYLLRHVKELLDLKSPPIKQSRKHLT